MPYLRVLRLLPIAILVLSVAKAQSLDHSITLDDNDPSSPDDGFGIALSADGVHAYASISGLVFGPNNDNIARLDVIAGAQLEVGTTEAFPEDPAITYDASGAVRNVYVTNSTTGSVSCFTATLVSVVDIPLPSCFGGSSYPFGLLVSPDQSRLYVTTIGGCGDVDVIDTDPASVTFNTVVGSFAVPNGGGRPSWGPYPQMVLPTTTPSPTFLEAQAGFAVVDVLNPPSQTGYLVTPLILNHWISTTECVVIPGGKVLLSVGGEVFPTVYECSIATGMVTRTLNLNTIAGIILHGLATNPDQTVGAVTSLNSGDTVFFDIATFTVIGVHNHGTATMPNDVVFTPDGSRAVVSLEGVARVDVLEDIPGYALKLLAPATATVGGPLAYGFDNVEWGQPFALYFSLAGAGPQQIGPYTIYLSNPFDLGYEAIGDLHGDGGVTFTVPIIPGLPGMTVSTQAVTIDRDGDIRLSNGKQTLIL